MGSLSWERGLFWIWLIGAVGWIAVIAVYVYEQTNGFGYHPSRTEWIAFLMLWSIPPILTFGVYLGVLWVGRRIASQGGGRWERDTQDPSRRFRRRG